VNAGETKVVWEMPVTGGFIAFIRKVAFDWYGDTYWEFIVDGIPEKIEFTIPSTDPERYDPPIIAYKRIKWIFHNTSTTDRTVGVLCDGELVREKA